MAVRGRLLAPVLESLTRTRYWGPIQELGTFQGEKSAVQAVTTERMRPGVPEIAHVDGPMHVSCLGTDSSSIGLHERKTPAYLSYNQDGIVPILIVYDNYLHSATSNQRQLKLQLILNTLVLMGRTRTQT